MAAPQDPHRSPSGFLAKCCALRCVHPSCFVSLGPLGLMCLALNSTGSETCQVAGFVGASVKRVEAGWDCWVLSRRGQDSLQVVGARSLCLAPLTPLRTSPGPTQAQPCPLSSRGGLPSGRGLGGPSCLCQSSSAFSAHHLVRPPQPPHLSLSFARGEEAW